jgi:uncharacterized RDD family membrane protein YckC
MDGRGNERLNTFLKLKTDPKISKRALALLIDYGIYLLFFNWLVTTYGVPNDDGGYSLNNDPKGWWIVVVWFLYFPIIESLKGQTLGKMIVKLQVVTLRGNSISFSQACKRHLLDLIDFSFFGLVAYITINNTPNHQRLGDLWAGTIVIGGDVVTCKNCYEELKLNAKEIRTRSYVCPSCNERVNL